MSTPLKDGIYALHYVPPGAKLPFAGGVYATGDQPNHPVLAQAHNPAVVKGFQKWHIKPALDSSPSDGKYTITAPGLSTPPGAGGHGPVVPGFGYDRFEGDQAILLTASLKEFYIHPANDGKDGDITYVITVPTPPGFAGAQPCLDATHGHVSMKFIPVTQHMPPRPTWQLLYYGTHEH